MKKIILVLVCLMMACSLGYQAQAQSNYVCLDTLSPYTIANSAWLMSNTAPNVYSLTTTVATAGYHQWWLLTISATTTTVTPPVVLPNSWSWLLTTTANQPVTFYVNRNPDTSWSPASTRIYTTASVSTALRFVPVFNATSLDGDPTTSDFTTLNPAYYLSYYGLDPASGDSIYALQCPIGMYGLSTASSQWRVSTQYDVTSGSYYYIGAGDSYGSNQDFAYKASTQQIITYFSSDTVSLQLDIIQGRIRYTHSGSSSAPWYALGDLTGYAPNGSNQLSYAGGGKYALTAPAATFASNTHFMVVINQVGSRYPSDSQPATSGPILNVGAWMAATTGQTVAITFDTNTYTDGFLPYTKFAYTSETSTIGAHVYCVVGDLSTFFGYGATNFTLLSAFTAAYNPSPLYVDLSSGDSIFTFQNVVVSTVTTTSQMRWKWILDDAYTQQIGVNGRSNNPPNNLINCIGGDTILFEVDVVSGRIRATNLTHAGYAVPEVSGTNGQPGHTVVFTATGGTPPYLVWNSSNTTAIQLLGFSGNTATVNLVNYGTSTVTVQDSYGQQGVGVFSVVPTSAPLAPDFENLEESRNTILWHINE